MSGLADLLVVLSLAGAVLSLWLGALAALRLRSGLDILHAVSFSNAVAGACISLAAFCADGPSPRSFKVLAMMLLLVLAGAALSHATGRALLIREGRDA
ncbi:monovalent cation/H(+) antiporter subunit G [Methylobacterium organophilum]|uniref:monovalent cation/H(+) antiporter subunit G n=1 Tax=Methylobacterium organophilum TaxID=410 RepID=UPI001F12D836|nr:monovalent cation/H(+) antiporter subunit G [Methylobacterium organophilum]UMY17360.1 monovalent cation/H(+) antiporter subunit G [Methylobacterium organophilum]